MKYKSRKEQWVRRLVSAGIPQNEIAKHPEVNLSPGRVSQIKTDLQERGMLNSENQIGGGGSDDAILWSFNETW